MQVNVNPVLKLLDGTSQYIVPRYQRPYSWELEQCRQLWEDIEALMERPKLKHFVGSVVYIQESSGGAAGDATYQLIDGQQRLTTVTLLLAALYAALDKRERAGWEGERVNAARVRESLLKNRPGEGRFKLILSQDDKETLKHVLDPERVPLPQKPAVRVLENYKFFQDLLGAGIDLETLYETLWRLQVVDIDLDRTQDNPQLIFESLNSTGLDLTQSDLTRNYVLMTLPAERQSELYDHFWHPMEEYFKGQTKKKTPVFDYFVRDFVMVRRGLTQSPNLDKVYVAFKKYIQEEDLAGEMDDVVRDMHQMAGYYAALVNPTQHESDKEVRQALLDLQGMDLDVWLPLGLHAYEAWQKGKISRDELVKVLKVVESYIFRRWAADLSSAGLNKVFPTLLPKPEATDYLASVQDALYRLTNTRRFPDNEEFKAQLGLRNLYSSLNWTRYTLGKLEKADNKEFAGVAGYTIEHIMPQNKKPSAEWREMLGEGWQEVQDTYLHTLGNLTLTKYNSEMSDSSFVEKRDMAGGFKDTGLRISKTLRDLDTWNKEAILSRAAMLADKATEIWPPLEPSEQLKQELAQQQQARTTSTTDDFLRTASPELRSLFEQVRDAVLELHADMQETPMAAYIAYKVGTNITDLVPQPGNEAIRAMLNIPFAELKDLQERATDVSGKGKHGNGEAEVILKTPLDIPAYIELVQQALDYQLARRTRTAPATAQAEIDLSKATPATLELWQEVDKRSESLGLASVDRGYYRSYTGKGPFVEVYPRQNWLRIWVKAPLESVPAEQQAAWQAGGKFKAWIVRNVATAAELEQVWQVVQQAFEAQDTTASSGPDGQRDVQRQEIRALQQNFLHQLETDYPNVAAQGAGRSTVLLVGDRELARIRKNETDGFVHFASPHAEEFKMQQASDLETGLERLKQAYTTFKQQEPSQP